MDHKEIPVTHLGKMMLEELRVVITPTALQTVTSDPSKVFPDTPTVLLIAQVRDTFAPIKRRE